MAAVMRDDFHLIGTSGTVTTLAGVHLDLPRYDRRKVDGIWLSDDEVSAMQAKLLSWDFASRAANPCIGPDRRRSGAGRLRHSGGDPPPLAEPAHACCRSRPAGRPAHRHDGG